MNLRKQPPGQCYWATLSCNRVRPMQNASPQGRYRYMVSLRVPPNGEHFCGGTLISDQVVLTAAHW